MISIIGEQILDCRRKRAHRWPGNSRGAVLLRPKAENLKVSGPRRPTRLETEHVTSRRNRGDGERVRRILEILDDSSHVYSSHKKRTHSEGCREMPRNPTCNARQRSSSRRDSQRCPHYRRLVSHSHGASTIIHDQTKNRRTFCSQFYR